MGSDGVKKSKKKKSTVFEKSKIDPSKFANKKKEEKFKSQMEEEDNQLNVLSGFGDLGEKAEIEMADGTKKIMSPFLLIDYKKALKLLKKFEDFTKLDPNEIVDMIIDLGFLSIKRKHPEVTKEYLLENVDLVKSRQIMDVVLHYAGMDSLKESQKKKE